MGTSKKSISERMDQHCAVYLYSRVSYRCEMNKAKLYLSAQINLKKHTVDEDSREPAFSILSISFK